ncbi:MAG TPA: hypothetical protein VJ301_11690 [Propionibacteriaceae bacterium]|nr:hypothetical protein [Propionibacteriaceae bacterium]
MRVRRRYYILDGDHVAIPVDVLTWARWLETADRHVGRTVLDGVVVSTVFLGLNHSYGDRHAARHIFETMVFGGPLDEECERYATWAQAEAGHAAMVARVQASK